MTRTEIKDWLKSLGDVADCKKTTDEVLTLIAADEMAIRELTRFVKSIVPVMREAGKASDEICEELGIDEIKLGEHVEEE